MPTYTVELVHRIAFELGADSEEDAIQQARDIWVCGEFVDEGDWECWLEDDEQD